MCFIKQRSVGEQFFLLTMEFYVKQLVCKNHLFSPSCFTDGHEAESTFGMVKRRFAPWRLYSSAECTSLRSELKMALQKIRSSSNLPEVLEHQDLHQYLE